MARPRIVTAAHVLCYVNGQLVGRVTSFSWNSLTPMKQIHGMDVAYPLEIAPTTTGVSFNITLLRTVSDGGAQGAGLTVPQNLISRQKYFTLVLTDRSTDTTIFKCDYCMADSESWTVAAKALVVGSVAGSGVIWTNSFG